MYIWIMIGPSANTYETRISYNPWDFGIITTPREIPPLPLAMVSQPNSASISLKEIASWDGVSQDIYRVVTTAFDAEDYLDCVKGLQAKGIDSKSYIDGLDKVRRTQSQGALGF